MAVNTRFAVAIHTAGMLALDDRGAITSETIARSVSTNPVVVRRVISLLARRGLVTVRKGKGGGATLARPAQEITLEDIYKAVEPPSLLPIPRMSGTIQLGPGKPECPVSQAVAPVLTEFFAHAEAGMIRRLGEFTLADFVGSVQHRMSETEAPAPRARRGRPA